MVLKLKSMIVLSAITLVACGDGDQSKLSEAIESTKQATSNAVDAVKEGAAVTSEATGSIVDGATEMLKDATSIETEIKTEEAMSSAVEGTTEMAKEPVAAAEATELTKPTIESASATTDVMTEKAVEKTKDASKEVLK